MDQIRIFQGREALNENITLYFEKSKEAKDYISLLKKVFPRTRLGHRHILSNKVKVVNG